MKTLNDNYQKSINIENALNLMKRIFYKSLPYVASIITGLCLFLLSQNVTSIDLKGLFNNLSATFLAIPILFFCYEQTKNFSDRKLNNEILDYLKMHVDTEILSITNHLIKILHNYKNRDASLNGIVFYLNLNRPEILDLIKNSRFLGFQVLKHWDITEKGLSDLLKNSFLVQRLNSDQLTSIIRLMKSIRRFAEIQNIDDIFVKTAEKDTQYEVKKGSELNMANLSLPDRYLLLNKIKDNSAVVDFGDFPEYTIKGLLYYYEINHYYHELYTSGLFDLFKEINQWLSLTGNEFIVDPKTFRQYPQSI